MARRQDSIFAPDFRRRRCWQVLHVDVMLLGDEDVASVQLVGGEEMINQVGRVKEVFDFAAVGRV